MKPFVKGDNKNGYKTYTDSRGKTSIFSDKGLFYKKRKEGKGKTVLSMSQIGRSSSFKKCVSCGVDLLPKWNICEACGQDPTKTRP